MTLAQLGARSQVSLRTYTTLKAGGNAEWFAVARNVDELAQAAVLAHQEGMRCHPLGWGSNLLPSDHGVPGLCVANHARNIEFTGDGGLLVDTGAAYQDLFLAATQRGWGGLEYAVGIPGTVGGALVSNAGAYRSNISEIVTEVEVVHDGERRWEPASFLEFRYRDSILRRPNPPAITVLRIRCQLKARPALDIYNDAREYQRQRIGKQPPMASAGSFFKNVEEKSLAESLETLPAGLKAAGAVPAGYLIEQVGLKGARYQGAMLGARHANFLLNVGKASASSLRRLAEHAQALVHDRFGVMLEPEVLYFGDWSHWEPMGRLNLDAAN